MGLPPMHRFPRSPGMADTFSCSAIMVPRLFRRRSMTTEVFPAGPLPGSQAFHPLFSRVGLPSTMFSQLTEIWRSPNTSRPFESQVALP